MRHLTVRELDRILLDGRRIGVTYGDAHEIVQCRVAGGDEVVAPALFGIYLDNGLIGEVGRNQFAVTRLGQSRLTRR